LSISTKTSVSLKNYFVFVASRGSFDVFFFCG
jgi:hypothetical protein